MAHFFSRACSIELPEMFILTGGSFRPFEAETKVSKYTKSGWMEDLPDLNEARKNHGCGFFYNDDMERVGISMKIIEESL